MIISRTPFRISFFGGGTDYPAWYRQHGGAVLATTIDKYCYINCRYLPPFFEHRYRVVWSKIENCHTIDEITHPAVRGVLQHLQIEAGVEIHHDGDLPARGGMGSSSAFTVGLLHALHALVGHMPSTRQLAAESIHVEQEILKETVGSQDQISAAYGGFNHITFHQNGEFRVRPMTLKEERIRELNAHLMLFYTGIRRTAADVADSYVQNVDARKDQFDRMGDMVEEGISIMTDGGDICRFGELLHQAWQAKRSLSARVSNSSVDHIYEQAMGAGALGGKLTGAGGGGFMLLFVPLDKQGRVRSSLKDLIHVPFKFDATGSRIIFFEPERDYSDEDEARRRQTLRAFQELAPDAD